MKSKLAFLVVLGLSNPVFAEKLSCSVQKVFADQKSNVHPCGTVTFVLPDRTLGGPINKTSLSECPGVGMSLFRHGTTSDKTEVMLGYLDAKYRGTLTFKPERTRMIFAGRLPKEFSLDRGDGTATGPVYLVAQCFLLN